MTKTIVNVANWIPARAAVNTAAQALIGSDVYQGLLPIERLYRLSETVYTELFKFHVKDTGDVKSAIETFTVVANPTKVYFAGSSATSEQEIAKHLIAKYDGASEPGRYDELPFSVEEQVLFDRLKNYFKLAIKHRSSNKKTDEFGLSFNILSYLRGGSYDITDVPVLTEFLVQIVKFLLSDSESTRRQMEIYGRVKFCFQEKSKPMKGASDLANSRPIVAIPVVNRLIDAIACYDMFETYAGVIDRRLQTAGFGLSGTDVAESNIATGLRHAVTYMMEHQGDDEEIVFMDVRDAFTNVRHNILFESLRKYASPWVYKHLASSITGSYWTAPDGAQKVYFRKGLLQGCTASNALFIIYMDTVLKDLAACFAGGRGVVKGFVDDIAVYFNKNKTDINDVIRDTELICARYGFELSWHKCVTANGTANTRGIKRAEIGEKYLGAYISRDAVKTVRYFQEEVYRPIIKAIKRRVDLTSIPADMRMAFYHHSVTRVVKAFFVKNNIPAELVYRFSGIIEAPLLVSWGVPTSLTVPYFRQRDALIIAQTEIQHMESHGLDNMGAIERYTTVYEDRRRADRYYRAVVNTFMRAISNVPVPAPPKSWSKMKNRDRYDEYSFLFSQ